MDNGVELILERLGSDMVGDVLRRYLSNPLFRSARYNELVLDDDPYRRPVRPEDLSMVDFSRCLERDGATQLSALMAHRILLNIFDARRPLLPRTTAAETWASFQLFYDQSSVALGELVRPYLERHVFEFVRSGARDRVVSTGKEVVGRIRELEVHRDTQAARLRDVIDSGADPASLIGMVAIQSLGQAINSGLRPATEVIAFAEPQRAPAQRIAELAGLNDEPHNYYQYYLPSTLALMNHLNSTHRPGQSFAHAGALVAQAVEARAMAGSGLVDAVGGSLVPEEVIERVAAAGGEFGIRELSRGIEEYAILLDVHDEDRVRQFTWITNMPYYRKKADLLQGAIEHHGIDVDMDTFVESWEECSTTHVHDDDRLLVIESGEMEFWNCFGVQHSYRPGDKAFVPKRSLHGSVVLSGECVYHQPIITAELDRRYGSLGQA